MQKLSSVSLILFLICCIGCKKNNNNRFSEWTVKGEKFSTNDVTIDLGKMVSRLYSGPSENGFYLQFNSHNTLPTAGELTLAITGIYVDTYAQLTFLYKGDRFVVSHNCPQVLHPSAPEGNPEYTLSPTWFIKEVDSTDSVLVTGVFRKP
jgi:hypothetical protein